MPTLPDVSRLTRQIIIRLNRAHALNTTRDPEHYARYNEAECSSFWRQLVGAHSHHGSSDETDTWRSREAALRFCSGVMEQRLDAARSAVYHRDDRAERDQLYAEEARAASIRQDLQVEAIIRQRTIQAFLSRCKGFAPPPKDDELLALPPRLPREVIR